jgi:hypothetical protein
MSGLQFFGQCFLAGILVSGCAAHRSDIRGAFSGSHTAAEKPEQVSVAFIFTHAHQNRGWDVIPKLNDEYRYVNGFYDLFRDALPELSNVGAYAMFIEHAEDVNEPRRRAERDSLAASHDYVIRMRFLRETSFVRQTLGTIGSTLSLTLLPVPYTRDYSITADIYDRGGRLLRTCRRDASVTNWVQAFLIFAYPFAPESRKTEEVYLSFLHDVFREIEAARILAGNAGPRL